MASYTNALGGLLYTSGATRNHYSATKAGPTMTGTTFNDTFWGDSSVRTVMSGGAGDDIYHLYSTLNSASEGVNAGIDTVNTWMGYTLPSNIENLTVTGAGRHAFGNALDNIINGASGQQTLNGLGGNDVLFGGAGNDIFVMERGNGSDVIRDFAADDVLRLDGYGFTSFSAVTKAMSQVGADVRLNLGNNEVAVLSNHKIADFKAGQFEIGIDLGAMTKTFADEFNGLSLWNGKSGTWDSNYWWGPANGNSLHGNGEKQWYVDTSYAPTASVNPFSTASGVLTIEAAPTSAAIKPLINNFGYTSGMLTTYESFSQTYGYFEIRADMPEVKGAWPAFWMLPRDGSWPPELDVIEMYGQDPTTLIMTAHSNETGKQTSDLSVGHVASTAGFHTYGLLWGAEEIVWYFDGVEIASTDTPSDMHKPMYMIVNLALGGVAGKLDPAFNGAEMKIDYIRAYQTAETTGAAKAAVVEAPNSAATQVSGPAASQGSLAKAASVQSTAEPMVVSGSPEPLTGEKAIGAVVAADGFDAQFYLNANPDVAASGMDPKLHFELYGAAEGRDPNALFDTRFYVTQNPDVAAAGVNPLEHYDAFGFHESRDPSAAFDTSAYLEEYADVAAAQMNPLTHYLAFGSHEGRHIADETALFL